MFYNKATGLYGGLKKILAHITLRRDEGERFYNYGYSKEKSTLLYYTMKQPLKNIFHCTAFKKRHGFILDENKNPALLDNKEIRRDVTGGYYKIMRKIAEISNQNLVRNSDAYLSSGEKVDPGNAFLWVDDSYKKGKDKFQLGY